MLLEQEQSKDWSTNADTETDVQNGKLHPGTNLKHNSDAGRNKDVTIDNINEGSGKQYNHDQSSGLRNRQYNAQIQNIYYNFEPVATIPSSGLGLAESSDIGRDASIDPRKKQQQQQKERNDKEDEKDENNKDGNTPRWDRSDQEHTSSGRSSMRLLQTCEHQFLGINPGRIPLQLFGGFVALTALCYGLVLTTTSWKPEPYQPSLNASLPVFAILGKTGVGKSSLINTLGGQNLSNGRPPEMCVGMGSCNYLLAPAGSSCR